MRKIDGVGNGISVCRIYRDKLVAFAHLQRVANAKIASGTPLLADSDLLNQFHKRLCAPIQNRQLQIVQFDNSVIDAGSDESRKQMLGSGNQYALLHKAGRVAGARDIPVYALDLQIVQVDAVEHNTGSRSCGQDLQTHRSAAV